VLELLVCLAGHLGLGGRIVVILPGHHPLLAQVVQPLPLALRVLPLRLRAGALLAARALDHPGQVGRGLRYRRLLLADLGVGQFRLERNQWLPGHDRRSFLDVDGRHASAEQRAHLDVTRFDGAGEDQALVAAAAVGPQTRGGGAHHDDDDAHQGQALHAFLFGRDRGRGRIAPRVQTSRTAST
jgi:hypothetical protein